MNIFLWVPQALLSLHTGIGAVWKLSNPAQTIPSLNAIPPGVWQAMSIIELLCAVGLVLPALNKSLAIVAPISALVIAAEMLLFSGVHLYSGEQNHGPMIYWLVVAAICGFIAYGRWVLRPL